VCACVSLCLCVTTCLRTYTHVHFHTYMCTKACTQVSKPQPQPQPHTRVQDIESPKCACMAPQKPCTYACTRPSYAAVNKASQKIHVFVSFNDNTDMFWACSGMVGSVLGWLIPLLAVGMTVCPLLMFPGEYCVGKDYRYPPVCTWLIRTLTRGTRTPMLLVLSPYHTLSAHATCSLSC
jgi:hypothetical protein